MSVPQPPVVDAAAPARPAQSAGGVIVRWLAWGVLAGVIVPVVFVLVRFAWSGFLVYLALPLMLVGATIGGTVGAIVGSGVVVFARGGLPSSAVRPTGYGPATLTRPPTPRPTRALLVGWLAALAVGWASCILYATALSGARLDPAIVVGVAAAFVGVALVATGALAIPHVRFAAITAIVIGPILTLGGFVMTIGASIWVAEHPPLTAEGEPADPEGAPPSESAEWDAPAEGSSNRIPGPPLLYSDGTVNAANVGSVLDVAARGSILIAPVADDDVSPDALFPANLVPCPSAVEGELQASTDIWFDSVNDPVAIQNLREYWVSLGYTVVVDDPDLVVVAGAPGLVGAQYSIERTWDDELRLRMQSVCVRE